MQILLSSPFKVELYLIEAAQGRRLVVESIEDGQQLCDRQQVLDLLRQAEELEIAALFLHGREAGHQLTDTAGVDITDAPEVEQYLVLALTE